MLFVIQMEGRARRTPLSASAARFRKTQKANQSTGGVSCKLLIEIFFFMFWMMFTGFAGYLVGYSTNPEPSVADTKSAGMIHLTTTAERKTKRCPDPPPPKYIPRKTPCPVVNNTNDRGGGSMKGYSLDEIKRMWTCSRAKGNQSISDVKLFPSDGSLEKTKWKTILAVEPNEFFKTYLSQYPGDTAAVQPVIVFSHKPLNSMKEVPQVCKVIDIAIVPDTPGVCVSVTETFHDVASYHMLHADRQPDGSFALTSNSMESRVLPDEEDYTAARALLSEYFTHQKKVETLMRTIPKPTTKIRTQLAGCFMDDLKEVPLYMNGFKHAIKAGVPSTKFWVFTSNVAVKNEMIKAGIHQIFVPELAGVGKNGDSAVGPKLRRYFIQAWLAFVVSDVGIRMLWHSPGTVWMGKPDHIVAEVPEVEMVWAYKGRDDPRSAPFFVSFDFFVHGIEERPVHLLHEILLHYDLVLAWDSLDAVASYRLSENNARYGTTTFMLAPYKVLHIDLLGRDVNKVKEAVASRDPPKVIVVPYEGMRIEDAVSFLQDTGLWML